jgi:tetratricopeptide (TPR) repeat protein
VASFSAERDIVICEPVWLQQPAWGGQALAIVQFRDKNEIHVNEEPEMKINRGTTVLRMMAIAIFVLFVGAQVFAADKSQPNKSDLTKGQVKKTSLAQKKDAEYWFSKGSLCATYGNDKAAINYFGKAMALDSANSRAYFSQGISYGQLGFYPKAITQVNRAIQMEPQNGLYYYGRGRVHLLSGDQDKALADFKEAARLGDEDALNYLNPK